MVSKIYYRILGQTTDFMDLKFIKTYDPGYYEKLISHDISTTHRYVAESPQTNLYRLFLDYQAENWSPNGEARPLIEHLNVKHTSMSVGDIVVQDDKYYFCDPLGWKEI